MVADVRIACLGIGSTNLRSAVGFPDGTFDTEIHVERTDLEDLTTQVIRRIEALQTHAKVDAVSIACAGLVDDGTIKEVDTPDDDVRYNIPIGPTIETEFGLPARLENDCTAAALAEWTYGAGQNHDCVIHLTMGTGIGAGVVDRGHVIRGAHGHATEVGLFPIGPPDRASSGVPGAWEAYCSGRGIAGFVRELLRDESRETILPEPDTVTAPNLFAAVERDDTVANDYLDRICEYNAAGLGAVVNAYNPDLITIGGGVGASNFETILERTRPLLEQYTLPEVPEIQPTTLGDEIGLYGALAPHATRHQSVDPKRVVAIDD